MGNMAQNYDAEKGGIASLEIRDVKDNKAAFFKCIGSK